MALRKFIETEGNSIVHTPLGVIENGTCRVSFVAYVKVTSINGNKNQVVADVCFIGDKVQFIKHYTIPVSVESNAPNFIEQVYKHLKTLSEFDGAEDC